MIRDSFSHPVLEPVILISHWFSQPNITSLWDKGSSLFEIVIAKNYITPSSCLLVDQDIAIADSKSGSLITMTTIQESLSGMKAAACVISGTILPPYDLNAVLPLENDWENSLF